ncbi:MAG: nitrilase-related carbon-nitrogen hydrolase [Rhizomicrobium sp.]|nr:nitrilase-related carbon-nitrogen hydrolase [Rhizomicrobium sp.]
MTTLIAVLCAALSGAAFYFSCGLGGSVSPAVGSLWAVALLAPVPVLWLAFRTGKAWVVFLTAFGAMLIGMANLLPAYGAVMPLAVLLFAIATPALGFAGAVMAARFVAQRLTPISGVIAFAALWTGVDYLLSQGPNGAASSPAYSQLELPWMIQGASVFGIWIITAVMGLFAAATAMYVVTKKSTFAIFAVAVVTLNLGYGAWRVTSAPQSEVVQVGLAGDDGLIRAGLKDDAASALAVSKAYAAAGRGLAQQGATLIVFPEKIAVVRSAWASAVNGEFANLASGHALVVAGVDARGPERKNDALVYFANGAAPQAYSKRHLVPGLEKAFTPGTASFMLGDHTGIAICKDMDFPDMLRLDAMVGPNLYAVPAWDFGADAVWHARLAMMRGVENGFAVARAANEGLLSVSDAYGRVLAVKKTAGGGMVTLRGAVARGPGRTLYADIGDGLAYLSLALSLLLLGVAAFAKTGTEAA